MEVSKKAVKHINALDKPTKQRIKAGIDGLTQNPAKGRYKGNTRFFRWSETPKNRKI